MSTDNMTPIKPSNGEKPEERFPNPGSEKIVVAKCILQAMRVAHDSGQLEEENYDMSWPLQMVIQLLEEAEAEVSAMEDKAAD